MTTEEKIQRLKELSQIEKNLKEKRDFENLIKIHKESLELFDSISNRVEKIPQIAYCLARLGKKDEARKTLEGLRSLSLFADYEELYRAVKLVLLFLHSEISDFGTLQINTIKNLLKDPASSKQALQIVFDYSDIVGDIKPFDETRLQIKQSFFSDELRYCVFAAMMRDESTQIYYNRETNDVQLEVEGYLISQMATDKTLENRSLANRITNFDSIDPIIEGIHFLIPRLLLNEFIEKFCKINFNNANLMDFVSEFESLIMEEYEEYVDSIDELYFSESVSNRFFKHLELWLGDNNLDELNSIINQTAKEITLGFLKDANK